MSGSGVVSVGAVAPQVLILDNGGWNCKVGFASQATPLVACNSIMKGKAERGKVFIANEIDQCRDMSGLFYQLPLQKGFLVNWDIQRTIWDHLFNKKLQVDCAETALIFTEPHFNLASIQHSLNEIFFEEYQFREILRSTASSLSAYKYCTESKESACLVLDSGYSFSHAAPYVNMSRCKSAVTRLEVGGKMLTNYLKDIISYRQLHVLDETYVMNQCKEDCCFVSSDFYNDMRITKEKAASNNSIGKEYVLPDYLEIRRGHIRDKFEAVQGKQIIKMNNERFSVPEILFSPSDIGIKQMGISEILKYSLSRTDQIHHPDLLANVLLTGGNACLPGFKRRIFSDLRLLADYDMEVCVHSVPDPTTYAWLGGKLLANSPNFHLKTVSRKQYLEHGSDFCNEKFDI